MQSEETRRRLLEKAGKLPLTPGVYLMRDSAGKIIYVGKSRKLKNRVSQYFQNSAKNLKTARMVSLVADFDYFLCDTEMEALTLENTLIKQHTPKYNIRLKDAKSYPYLKITNEPYPRLLFTRTRASDKAHYFGPYSGVSVAGSVLRTLEKTLCLPTCNRRFPRDIGKERPCLYYRMGQCCGVCTGQVSEEEYGKRIALAAEILRGNTAGVRREVRAEMDAAAEAELFEKAASLRDTLFALEKLSEKQTVVASPDVSEDVFGFYQGENIAVMAVFYVRGGALVDKSETVFGENEILGDEALVSYLYDHYCGRNDVPPRVLLSFSLEEEETELLSATLTQLAGRKVTLHTPERGALKTLCELAVSNAAERAASVLREEKKENEILSRLASALALETLPERIESYDISNFGAEHKTCGMIVVENGKFRKSDYRTFRIRDVEGTDDYASMRESIRRRFAHLDDEGGAFSNLPDLILLDGGMTHVATVRQVLREMGIDVPVFGMVKDDFHKTRALCDENAEISIARDRVLFNFIYGIQEEVHRYSIRRMSGAKEKTLRTSSLEKIPGVGKEKARALLKHFGGLSGVKSADRAALAGAPGVGAHLADTVYEYFHREDGEK